jgi:predicted membrane chloride channel (bestrophin family)
MILPLFLIGAWSTAITVISKKVHPLGTDSVLLTISGFVVGLGLSFRSSTAYERYKEARKYFATLATVSQTLGRIFWVHTIERPEVDSRAEILCKLNATNLIVAFAISLKHHLRFEPYTFYADLQHLVGHLNTFSKKAAEAAPTEAAFAEQRSIFKDLGECLGISFAISNPRRNLKRTHLPVGNLPLEILNHLSAALDKFIANGQLPVPAQQTLAFNNIAALNDVLSGCLRILNTPLPSAYAIVISQITWLYVTLLPFQLVERLGWIAIPATVAASYIILGLLFIGQEIEHPFGEDVNDLHLDMFCDQIAEDMDIITSYDKRESDTAPTSMSYKPLYPISTEPIGVLMQLKEETVRNIIKDKPVTMFNMRYGQRTALNKPPKGVV